MTYPLSALSGISYLAMFRGIPGKRILILGESHQVGSLCSPDIPGMEEVHFWLEDLAKVTPQCLDIFLESNYLIDRPINLRTTGHLPLTNYRSPIIGIHGVFTECIRRRNKVSCKSDNVRFHFGDLRHIFVQGKNINFPLQTFASRAIITSPKPILSEFYDKVNYILRFLIYGTDEITGENLFYNLCARLTAIYYQDSFYRGSSPVNLQDTISYLNYYRSILTTELGKIEDRDHFLDVFYHLKLQTIKEKPRNSHVDLLWELSVLPMDLYIMARMIMKFNTKDRGPSGCQSITTPSNIIIVTGSRHSKFYTRFINQYFLTSPDILISNSNQEPEWQCIKFSQPFEFFAD